MKLADIVGLKEGMDVRLNIEVQAGSNNVRANQYFTYKEDAALSAYYEATGTSLDAAVTFIKRYRNRAVSRQGKHNVTSK